MTARSFAKIRTASLSVYALILPLLASWPAQAVELDDKIEVCNGCHGDSGLPAQPDIPIIWGQEFYYLYVQLKDYQAGRRDNEFMTDIVADLSKKEMRALAQYFSEKSWPSIGYRTNGADVASAEVATNSGMCPQCHLGGYEGDSRVPRLAGQQPGYLERTMLEFKNRVRLNSQAKVSLFATYDDTDIGAMARYLAGL